MLTVLMSVDVLFFVFLLYFLIVWRSVAYPFVILGLFFYFIQFFVGEFKIVFCFPICFFERDHGT